ncbi:TlpA family protein disulfide reductase [Roseovarius sp. C7]|uniref:TlpA family protein disulfide reductase n=1 Tax=Roseovarius sp. C7 TaxID=3398643 RepID=UPI0039F6FAB8
MQGLLDGSMKKLTFHSAAKPVPDAAFLTEEGGEATLADYQGKYLLVNFWATWCAPCRKEMPMLAALQSDYGGEDFEVLTIATGRNPPPAMKAFFAEIGVDNLPLHRDPKQVVSRAMGVAGLPVSVLIDPQGREIARMLGDAEWDSPSARAMLEALITK